MMLNIIEGDFSGKQCMDDAQEFIGSGNNGFFMFHFFFSSSFVVSAEHLSIKDGTDGHMPDGAARVAVAPFRDSILTFEFSRLLDYGVQTGARNEIFIRGGNDG